MKIIKRLAKIAIRLIIVGILCIIGLVVFLWVAHNQVVTLPGPAGPYAVGRTEYDWVDESRPETLTPDQNLKRELVVWIWYPADPPPQATPFADYLPQYWRAARDQDMGFQALFLSQNLALVHDHSQLNLPISEKQASYPVLVMQPGMGSAALDYTTLAENMASQGYVVAGITPTYSANVVAFPDGRVALRTRAGNPPDDVSFDESNRILSNLIEVWAADERFTLDKLDALNNADPSGRFTNRLNLQLVGAFGHSFGGATAALVCQLDPRFKAGIDIDGTLFGSAIQAKLDQPFMFILSQPPKRSSAALIQSQHDIQAMYNNLPHAGYIITINGARHMNFSDLAVRYRSLVGLLLKAMGAVGRIRPERALTITNDYVSAFFNKYLQNKDAPLLSGPSQQYPEVIFQAR
jgi:predicted dienelactone hydrolase